MEQREIDALIQELFDSGASVIPAIKIVRERADVDLGTAKSLVSQHPAWRRVVEYNQPLHDDLEKVFWSDELPEEK